ncbi:UNVERIFIED_CONTAM: hypothetical protein FKN15_047781 [Acipenser sinensis]
MMSKLNKPKRGTPDPLPLDSATKGPADPAEPAPVSMSAVVSELEKLRAALTADLTAEFQNSFASFKASIDAIQTTVTSHGHRIDILEHSADDTGDRVRELEASCVSLAADNKAIKEKLSDLENRSRSQNLRIIGLPEGLEGSHPTKFMSDFFVELFGSGALGSAPELDRAHRCLVPRPAPHLMPRPVIVRFHRYRTKELVLRLARERGTLTFREQKIFIFPDLSSDVARNRAAFRDIKTRLFKKGIKFSLLYPARLRIVFKGRNLIFTLVQEAEAFYDNDILPCLEVSTDK